MEKKSELLAEIIPARERIAETVAGIPDDRIGDVAMDTWTGKDLVAHMAWWHDHSARVIGSLLAGQEPYDQKDPANETAALNAKSQSEHAGDSADAVRTAFGASFNRLLNALEACSDDDLFRADRFAWCEGEALAETILWDTSRHYEAHRASLEALAG